MWCVCLAGTYEYELDGRQACEQDARNMRAAASRISGSYVHPERYNSPGELDKWQPRLLAVLHRIDA